MILGPNGKPVVRSEGPTGRRLIIHEIMVKGKPELKLEAHGQWVKPCSTPQAQAKAEIAGRCLMSTYFNRMSIAALSTILSEFNAEEVEKEVQGHINNLAQKMNKEK